MDRKRQDAAEYPQTKRCAYCHAERPLEEFQRRTGRRAGPNSRRGACRECRRRMRAAGAAGAAAATAAGADKPSAADEARQPSAPEVQPNVGGPAAGQPAAAGTGGKRRKRRGKRGGRKRNRRRQAQAGGADAAAVKPEENGCRTRRKAASILPPMPLPPRPVGPDPSVLSPGKSGVIWMRGRTDKGRRWRQETDLETAVTLVREYAAVVVNRRTIRRLYSNKAFREYILKRDNYTCYFCGKYGDTIDHIVPRAKGGHTTPVNCVTACRECNQNKAALDLDEFMERLQPQSGEPT
ncbi:MAG: restriction endonuclease [Paenibacillaceae bacterium]|nr:MAG: restriction endonuclease [Paenibacillaceae bacterium]